MDPEASAHGVPGPVGRGAGHRRGRPDRLDRHGERRRGCAANDRFRGRARRPRVRDSGRWWPRRVRWPEGSRSLTRSTGAVRSNRTTCVLLRSWFPARSRAAYVSVDGALLADRDGRQIAGDHGRRNGLGAGRRIADARYSAAAVGVARRATVTGTRFQPDSFGAGLSVAVVTGGVSSVPPAGVKISALAPLPARRRPEPSRHRAAESPCDRSGDSTSTRRSTRYRLAVSYNSAVASPFVPGRPGYPPATRTWPPGKGRG